ncbi:class I SAM-dependent methyltransferase [Candidatus Woesearchaeota archaeon]|nr:class I SAM-dependent methyltransferase [Candidatus Woesearchaeota archaeon]
MTARSIPSASLKQFLKKEIENSKRILDIGCGDGTIAIYLISCLNCYINGIDLDKGKIHRANEKFRKKPKKGLALCRLCDSRKINKLFRKHTFDAVLITHTIHHLIDINDVLLKARYTLKPSGKIFIGEYRRDYGEKIDNCPRFSNKKIKSMLRTAGFRNIKKHLIHKNFVMIAAVNGR